MPSFGVSRFAMPALQPVFDRMVKGNSPFGAWVVCVYRLKAFESLIQINATTRAFFVYLHNRRNLCRVGTNSVITLSHMEADMQNNGTTDEELQQIINEALATEDKDNFVTRFFQKLDEWQISRHKSMIARIEKGMNEYSEEQKSKGAALFHEMFQASIYSNASSSTKTIWRFIDLTPLVLAIIGAIYYLMDKDTFEEIAAYIFGTGLFVVILGTALWKHISMALLRFATTFLFGGIITLIIVLALDNAYGAGIKGVAPCAVLAAEICAGVFFGFFLLWNFFPKKRKTSGRKKENDDDLEEMS